MTNDTVTPLIELTNFSLDGFGRRGLQDFSLALFEADVCVIETDEQQDAHNLLRALATLTPPVQGTYRFRGQRLEFSDYRTLLPFKRKIGYIAPDSTLIRNRTLRENLLFMRSYFENSLSIDLDAQTSELCRIFEIENKLDMRPGTLNPIDIQLAVTIREMAKKPELMLLNRPEDYVGHNKFDLFVELLKRMFSEGITMVVLSHDKRFTGTFANKKGCIANGRLTGV